MYYFYIKIYYFYYMMKFKKIAPENIKVRWQVALEKFKVLNALERENNKGLDILHIIHGKLW